MKARTDYSETNLGEILKLLTPYIQIDKPTDLTVERLELEGIAYLLIDLDDTLVASFKDTIDPSYITWLNDLQAEGIQIVILSNGGVERVAYWLEYLNLSGIALAAKPLPFAFSRGLSAFNTNNLDTSNVVNKSNCAMLGDQLFTDIFGANVFGIRSILVKPLSAGKAHTRLLRKLENFYFARVGT